jgi:hypothetical protein
MAALGQPLNNNMPAGRHFSITPSDDDDLQITPRAIYVGQSGNISITDGSGETVVYQVESGFIIPFRAVRVNSTGTTATELVGWY